MGVMKPTIQKHVDIVDVAVEALAQAMDAQAEGDLAKTVRDSWRVIVSLVGASPTERCELGEQS
jgi:hypothetical protein